MHQKHTHAAAQSCRDREGCGTLPEGDQANSYLQLISILIGRVSTLSEGLHRTQTKESKFLPAKGPYSLTLSLTHRPASLLGLQITMLQHRYALHA